MKFRLASGESAERFTRNSVSFGAGASTRPAGRVPPAVWKKEKAKRKSKMDRDTITDKTNSIADRAKRTAENQKNAGADQLGRMAQAVHRAGDALREEWPGTAAYAEEAARSLERTAMSIREPSIDDLLRDASEFARREPALVFAGAALAAFALSRFLVSSGRGQNERVARSNHARPKI